jgi:hypothetical protein
MVSVSTLAFSCYMNAMFRLNLNQSKSLCRLESDRKVLAIFKREMAK